MILDSQIFAMDQELAAKAARFADLHLHITVNDLEISDTGF